MSQALKILAALAQHGTSTYEQLEQHTAIPRNNLRWAMNDIKQRKLVTQTEDPQSNAVAWKITPAGQQLVDANSKKQAASALPAVKKPEDKKYQSKPGPKAAAKSNKRVDTPADDGANNIGSSASDSPVGAATTSTEGAAVVETRAEGHDSEAGQAAEPVVSDENSKLEHGPLIATLGLNGNLLMQNNQGEFYLPAHQVRQLGEFLLNTFEVWGRA